MKKNNFKSILAILTVFLLLFLCSCGATASMFDNAMGADSAPKENDLPLKEVTSADGYNGSYESADVNGSHIASDRMLIITNNTTVEALDFDKSVELVRQRCQQFEGYIQSSELRGIETGSKYGTRYAYFSLRIPSSSFEAFMAGTSEFGNVLSSYTSGDDVTEEYYDSEARLETLKIQEERYLALLEKAADMDSIIVLEKALAEVRYQIEALTGTLRRYDSLVNYATVNIRINEVYQYSEVTQEPALTLGDKLAKQLSDSFEALKDVGEFLLVVFVAMLPFLVVIAIIVVIIIVIVRIFLKKSKKVKNENHGENNEK